jgi:hypothetical protein
MNTFAGPSLGWWGIISLFVNPITIIHNVSNYNRAMKHFAAVGRTEA